MSTDPLFTPIRMGNLHLPNRIVMAPLTRMRAGSLDHVPTQLQADYYAQRPSAGLIVAEATAISPEGFGFDGVQILANYLYLLAGRTSPIPTSSNALQPARRSRRSIGKPSTQPARVAIPTTRHFGPPRA